MPMDESYSQNMERRGRPGRPTRRKVASTAYVTVRCTKSERDRWHRVARECDLSLADLIRRELKRVEDGLGEGASE